MPYPVHADLLGADPRQDTADPGPQAVIAAGGDRPPVPVAQQLPAGPGVPFLAVLGEPGHQGGRDRLPADGLLFLAQPDQALAGVEVIGPQRERPATPAVSVCRRSSVSSSGWSPPSAAAWQISASGSSVTARRVEGRRRGLSTFRAGFSPGVMSPSSSACLYRSQRGDQVLGGAAPAAGVAPARRTPRGPLSGPGGASPAASPGRSRPRKRGLRSPGASAE